MDSIKLLQTYFKGETIGIDSLGDSFNPKEELRKQNEQSLAPFLYYVYGDVFYKVYLGAVLIQEKFYKIQELITSLFNENDIDHFFTKGSIVSKYYPDSCLRTRGDIDVLVREKDYEKAKKILLENNFVYFEVASHHVEFKYNGMMVELHKELFEQTRIVHDYFKNCFDHAVKVDKNYYELDINYHYIYLLTHFNRHLVAGEGLRYLLDFYFVSKKCSLDFNYINKELEKLNLTKLHTSIINAIYVLTNEYICECEKYDVSEFLDYMQSSGIHSKKELESKDAFLIDDGSKIKRLYKILFLPDKETRTTLYPKLSKHIVLYPILLVHRVFYLLKHKSRKAINMLRTDKKYLNKQMYIHNKFGIVKTKK